MQLRKDHLGLAAPSKENDALFWGQWHTGVRCAIILIVILAAIKVAARLPW